MATSKKFIVKNGLEVTDSASITLDANGVVTATTYIGDGSQLTGISAGGTDSATVSSIITADVDQSFVNALEVDAGTLDDINSTSFLRSDASDTYSGGTLSIKSNATNGYFLGLGLKYDGGWRFTNDSSMGMAFRNNATGGYWHMYIADSAGTANSLAGDTKLQEYRFGGTDGEYIKVGGNTVFHEGNDGTGSGLDADLLDGVQGTSFLRSDAADNKTSGNLVFNDNVEANFGTGFDLRIFHDGTNNILRGVTNPTYIQTDDTIFLTKNNNSETMAKFIGDGAVELYYDNSKKLETVTGGVTVTGTATATTFSGSGASLTNLPAEQLSGDLPALSGSALLNVDAETLDGINSTSFLRSDAADAFSGVLTGTAAIELNGGVTYDPSSSGSGTDTATDVAISLGSGKRIVGHAAGFIRTLLEWNSSSSLVIGQNNTALINHTLIYGGTNGGVKLYRGSDVKFSTTDYGATVTGTINADSATINGNISVVSTDAGASEGPIISLYRNSASPADADEIGRIKFDGEDDAGNQTTYAQIEAKINDVSNGTEDGVVNFKVMSGGSMSHRLQFQGNGKTNFYGRDVQLNTGVNLVFEGATSNANETTLTVVDPTGDNTITFPDATGTVALTSSDITGNAATATALATARNIDITGVTATAQSFDGTGNISIPITDVPASLLSGTIADARLPASITSDITGNAATADSATSAASAVQAQNAAALDNIGSGSFLRSDAADTKTSGNLVFNDNVELQFGTGNDFDIVFNGTNAVLRADAGNISIQPSSGGNFNVWNGTGFLIRADMSGDDVELYASGTKRLETTVYGATVTGTINADSATITGDVSAATFTGSGANLTSVDADTLDGINSTSFLRSDAADTKTSGDLSFSDNVKAIFGTGSDLEIYHDGTRSRITDAGTGSLRINTNNLEVRNGADGEDIATFAQNGAVELYYDNSKKFETASGGVTITGTATATAFSGDGSALTNLPASTPSQVEVTAITLGANQLSIDSEYSILGVDGINLSATAETVRSTQHMSFGAAFPLSNANEALAIDSAAIWIGRGKGTTVSNETSYLTFGDLIGTMGFHYPGHLLFNDSNNMILQNQGGNFTIRSQGSVPLVAFGGGAFPVSKYTNGNQTRFFQSVDFTDATVTGLNTGSSVTVSLDAPSSPSSGDLWYDAEFGNLLIYYDDSDTNQWVTTNAPSLADSTISSSKFINAVSLIIYDSSGSAVKTLFSPDQ